MAGQKIVPFSEKKEQPFDRPGYCDKDSTSQYIFRSGKGIPGPLLPLPILVRLPWSKFYKVQFTNSKNPCCTVHCKKNILPSCSCKGWTWSQLWSPAMALTSKCGTHGPILQ